MISAIRLYAQYVSASFRSQMQYRASFIMTTVAHFFMTGLEFIAIWVLFDRFERLGTWRLEEVCIFYGLINMSFALTDATSRGFDLFATMVKSGEFDRLLLRPRSTQLPQLCTGTCGHCCRNLRLRAQHSLDSLKPSWTQGRWRRWLSLYESMLMQKACRRTHVLCCKWWHLCLSFGRT